MIKLSETALKNKRAYDKEYAKKNFKSKLITFNKLVPDDIQLLDWVNSQTEQGNNYIKRLIREDMIRQTGKKDV